MAAKQRSGGSAASGIAIPDNHVLDAARVPANGMCWWCGERPATTGEHRTRASDLRRMAEKDADGRPIPSSLYRGGQYGYVGELKTFKRGPAIQWQKTMCKTCNGGRDHRMDRAWDVFTDYLWRNQGLIARSGLISWKTVYGRNWRPHALDLGRFRAKQVGCMLAEDSLPIPQDLIDFMDGAASAQTFAFLLVRDGSREGLRRWSAEQGDGPWGEMRPPTPASLSPDGTRLTGFNTVTFYGPVGVRVMYDVRNPLPPDFFAVSPVELPWENEVDPREAHGALSARFGVGERRDGE